MASINMSPQRTLGNPYPTKLTDKPWLKAIINARKVPPTLKELTLTGEYVLNQFDLFYPVESLLLHETGRHDLNLADIKQKRDLKNPQQKLYERISARARDTVKFKQHDLNLVRFIIDPQKRSAYLQDILQRAQQQEKSDKPEWKNWARKLKKMSLKAALDYKVNDVVIPYAQKLNAANMAQYASNLYQANGDDLVVASFVAGAQKKAQRLKSPGTKSVVYGFIASAVSDDDDAAQHFTAAVNFAQGLKTANAKGKRLQYLRDHAPSKEKAFEAHSLMLENAPYNMIFNDAINLKLQEDNSEAGLMFAESCDVLKRRKDDNGRTQKIYAKNEGLLSLSPAVLRARLG